MQVQILPLRPISRSCAGRDPSRLRMVRSSGRARASTNSQRVPHGPTLAAGDNFSVNSLRPKGSKPAVLFAQRPSNPLQSLRLPPDPDDILEFPGRCVQALPQRAASGTTQAAPARAGAQRGILPQVQDAPLGEGSRTRVSKARPRVEHYGTRHPRPLCSAKGPLPLVQREAVSVADGTTSGQAIGRPAGRRKASQPRELRAHLLRGEHRPQLDIPAGLEEVFALPAERDMMRA